MSLDLPKKPQSRTDKASEETKSKIGFSFQIDTDLKQRMSDHVHEIKKENPQASSAKILNEALEQYLDKL